MHAVVQHYFHAQTGTLSYVVSDPESAQAAVIDPVLGFCAVSGRTDRSPVDHIVSHLETHGLELAWILETHAHADHLSGAKLLQREMGGRIAIGQGIRQVQDHFAGVFNIPPSVFVENQHFDRLLSEGDALELGELEIAVMETPGHTSDGLTYVVGNAAFVGDTLFSPPRGTARCDFPGGDAGLLYDSIERILALPRDTLIYLCHDYPGDGQAPCWRTSVAEQRQDNIHVGGGADRSDFVARRTARDAELSLPALILPAIQVNICGGALPPAEGNGTAYLRIPLDRL